MKLKISAYVTNIITVKICSIIENILSLKNKRGMYCNILKIYLLLNVPYIFMLVKRHNSITINTFELPFENKYNKS